jgi:voltage-gated potassium channel
VRKTSRYALLGRAMLLLVLVVATGVYGLMLLEHYDFLDALYMTIITLSTVGFGEVQKLSARGHIFLIFLIVVGLSVMTYTLGALARLVIEGEFRELLGRRRMVREISALKDHYIVCGHGRMGQILCQELNNEGVSFLVVEGNAQEAENLRRQGYLVLEGDATQDEILAQAGITRAKGLVAVVSSDVDNLYITLSAREAAREANPRLYILARASDPHAARKIAHAGADRVISPYQIGGMRLVQALLRPTAYDYLEIISQSSGMDLMIEEVTVGSTEGMAGRALRDSGIRQRYDVIIIGIKEPGGNMIFNPGPDTVIEPGDVLILLGRRTQIAELRRQLA